MNILVKCLIVMFWKKRERKRLDNFSNIDANKIISHDSLLIESFYNIKLNVGISLSITCSIYIFIKKENLR